MLIIIDLLIKLKINTIFTLRLHIKAWISEYTTVLWATHGRKNVLLVLLISSFHTIRDIHLLAPKLVCSIASDKTVISHSAELFLQTRNFLFLSLYQILIGHDIHPQLILPLLRLNKLPLCLSNHLLIRTWHFVLLPFSFHLNYGLQSSYFQFVLLELEIPFGLRRFN